VAFKAPKDQRVGPRPAPGAPAEPGVPGEPGVPVIDPVTGRFITEPEGGPPPARRRQEGFESRLEAYSRSLAVMAAIGGLAGLGVIAFLALTPDPAGTGEIARRFYVFTSWVLAAAYVVALGSALLVRRNPRLQATLVRLSGMTAFGVCWFTAGTRAVLHFVPAFLLIGAVIVAGRGPERGHS